MAEDFGDKTEAPTPKRRQEAREEGNIARSPDLTAAAVLLGALVLLQWQGQELGTALREVAERLLSAESLRDSNPWAVGDLILSAAAVTARAMAPLVLGVAIVAICANILQVGFFLNTTRLRPNFKSLNPVNGLKRIFGGGNGWMGFVMSLAKVLLVGTVGYSAVHGRMGEIVGMQTLSILAIFQSAGDLLYSIALRMAMLLLVLAILDYAWQRFQHERKLRMTKQQVKEELKRMEGDPLIRARRRQIAQQRAAQRIRAVVPTADVVVTNPTEYAVALKYQEGEMTAPKVIAKGRGFVAQNIRQIAIENGVPILERPPLARALWRTVEVGQEIPETFYAAVAEILAYVYELTGRVSRRVSA
jgi:flagellar biosynthesis protein FlhB